MTIFNFQFSIFNKKKSLPREALAEWGFSLVEIVVMVFITTSSIFFIWNIYSLYVKISISNPSIFQASFLAEEGIEAVKFMRDEGWSDNLAPLSVDIPYYLIFDGSSWEATTAPSLIMNRFDRRLTLSEVYRDGSGDIASSGTLDPDTKKILLTVSWPEEGMSTSTRSITTYVSDIFDN